MGVVESSPQAPQMENMTKRNHRNGKTASLSISLRGIERKDSCLSSTLRKISILTIGAFTEVTSYTVMCYATKNRKFETQPSRDAFSHPLQLCHVLLLLGENGEERECKSAICKEEGGGESFNF